MDYSKIYMDTPAEYEDLFRAVCEGDQEYLRAYFKKGGSVNEGFLTIGNPNPKCTHNGDSLLEIATRLQDWIMMMLLIEHGADPDDMFYVAIAQDDINLFNKILSLGFKPNSESMISAAAACSGKEIINQLLSLGYTLDEYELHEIKMRGIKI